MSFCAYLQSTYRTARLACDVLLCFFCSFGPTQLKQFFNDESGATAIEYGLIAALVSIAIIAALNALRLGLTTTFGKVSTTLTSAAAK